MRRRCGTALTVIAVVHVGAMLNTAIAWGLVWRAGWFDGWSAPHLELVDDDERWLWEEGAPKRAPSVMMAWRAAGAESLEASLMLSIDADAGESYTGATQRTVRAGWPCHALETRDSYPATRPWRPRFFSEGIWINSWEQGLGTAGPKAHGQIILPLVPRPVGFTINTAFYSVLSVGVLLLPRRVRRWNRRRRGRCSWCNYEVGRLAACPECGRSRS